MSCMAAAAFAVTLRHPEVQEFKKFDNSSGDISNSSVRETVFGASVCDSASSVGKDGFSSFMDNLNTTGTNKYEKVLTYEDSGPKSCLIRCGTFAPPVDKFLQQQLMIRTDSPRNTHQNPSTPREMFSQVQLAAAADDQNRVRGTLTKT